MPEYRVYVLGRDGRISRPAIMLNCPDDANAIEQARPYAVADDITVWEAARCIATFKDGVAVPITKAVSK